MWDYRDMLTYVLCGVILLFSGEYLTRYESDKARWMTMATIWAGMVAYLFVAIRA